VPEPDGLTLLLQAASACCCSDGDARVRSSIRPGLSIIERERQLKQEFGGASVLPSRRLKLSYRAARAGLPPESPLPSVDRRAANTRNNQRVATAPVVDDGISPAVDLQAVALDALAPKVGMIHWRGAGAIPNSTRSTCRRACSALRSRRVRSITSRCAARFCRVGARAFSACQSCQPASSCQF
jgi:hypothetical protein